MLTIDGGQSAVTKISNVTILGGGGTQGGGIKIDGGANPSQIMLLSLQTQHQEVEEEL